MSDTRTPVVAISLSGSRRSFSLTVGRGGCCQRGRDAGPSAAPRERGAPGPPCAGVYDPRDFSGKVRATHSQQGYWLCLLILTHTSPQARRAPPCDSPHEEVPTPLSRSARPRPCEGGSKRRARPSPPLDLGSYDKGGDGWLRHERNRLAARRPFPTVSPTLAKRLEGNAPSPALGACGGRSGSPLPSSHRFCFQRQGDWWT